VAYMEEILQADIAVDNLTSYRRGGLE